MSSAPKTSNPALEQPWKAWLEAERSTNSDIKEARPWVEWKPNPDDPSEKPWLQWQRARAAEEGDPDPNGPTTEMMGTFTNVPRKSG
jgi:hypothetical protein